MSYIFNAAGIFSPTTLNLPVSASPAQTGEGQPVWDSDDDVLTIGTGASRKTLVDLTATQTLSGKTLTAPVIADFTSATHDHGDADDGGALTGTHAITLSTAAQPNITSLGTLTSLTVSGDIIGQDQMALGTINGAVLFNIGTNFTGTSIAAGIRIVSALTPASGNNTQGIRIGYTIGSAAVAVGSAYGLEVAALASGTSGGITNLFGAYVEAQTATVTNAYGLYINAPTGGSTLNIGLRNGGTSILIGNVDLGVAGATLGVLKFNGNTSGTVTMQGAAAAGTWTMTLPTAAGTGGFQLTDAAGNGITSWAAAASRREWKNDLGVLGPVDARDALNRFLDVPIHRFTFKEDQPGTGDYETEYRGVFSDEAPWAMHHKGNVLNPISFEGDTILAIRALEAELRELELQAAEWRT